MANEPPSDERLPQAIVAVLLLAGLVVSAARVASAGGGQLTMSPPSVEIRDLVEGESRSIVFDLRNDGPLERDLSIRATCSCSAVSPREIRVLPSSSSIKITARLDTSMAPGRHAAAIQVYRGNVVVAQSHLVFSSRPAIITQPSALHLGTKSSASVELFALGRHVPASLRAEEDSGAIEVSLRRINTRKWVLEARSALDAAVESERVSRVQIIAPDGACLAKVPVYVSASIGCVSVGVPIANERWVRVEPIENLPMHTRFEVAADSGAVAEVRREDALVWIRVAGVSHGVVTGLTMRWLDSSNSERCLSIRLP